MFDYIVKLTLVCFLILIYYKYFKSIMIHLAPKIAKYLKLTQHFPTDDIKGAIELVLIASSHVIFCLFLIFSLPIDWPFSHISFTEMFLLFIYAVLIGIGCMGISGLLCKIIVQVIDVFSKDNHYDLRTWLTVSRGGWVKHHLQSIEILPIYLSVLVLTMQVGSEEIIFRGILINYFIVFGPVVALTTSLILFVGMQALLMNRWQSAIFPMLGALVMGIVHSILYLNIPVLWPLVIAHVTFFLFAVL